ncbi:MAG: NADH-quinone oxidoreductase subunit N [Anaerolineae bacterium]|nr:NADH-quinone oxidoreductase subunit N [Anaerolineae bacterium]
MFSAPTMDTFAALNMGAALPAIALAVGTMIVLLVDVFLPDERKHWTPILALSGLSASFIMTLFNLNPSDPRTFDGMFVADSFTAILNLIVLATAFLSILLSTDYLRVTSTAHGEYYSLVLISAVGAMFMAGANDLLVVFIALELLSIPLYVLAAFRVTRKGQADDSILKSEEGGMKYLILGAFASAFFVYGAALIYGASGTTNLNQLFDSVPRILADESSSARVLLLLGTALMFVGLGFKVAAVPFHMWTPDVYEGAPTPITAFMSIAAKVGGFASLLRIMVVGLSGFSLAAGQPAAWQMAVQVVAALTLIIGNVVALSQTNLKRMLAYSSIAHAGYILMAVAAVGSAPAVGLGVGNAAAQGALVYLVGYMFTNLGAFAIVMTLEKPDGSGTNLEDISGLYNSRPVLALAMAIFMLSLIGVPLTSGFMGKWLVFGAAVQAGLIPLAVIGVLTSVISAFYYMRVVVNMFLKTEAQGDAAIGATAPVTWAIYASVAGVLLVGILPVVVTNLVNLVQLV